MCNYLSRIEIALFAVKHELQHAFSSAPMGKSAPSGLPSVESYRKESRS